MKETAIVPNYTAADLDNLFRSGMLERLGMGSRRTCYKIPGTKIGEGAIIQAGSVVHGEIPPCAIAGDNPAKVFAWRDKEHYEKLKSQGAYFATNSRFINGGVGV